MQPHCRSFGSVIGALIVILAVSVGTAGARSGAPAAKTPATKERIAETPRAWLGTALASLTDVDRKQKGVPRYGGVLVLRVLENSPASRTGFLAGDVIMRFESTYVYKPDDIIKRVVATPVGRSVKIDVIRNGGWLTASVKLTARPSTIPPVASETRPQTSSDPPAPLPKGAAPKDASPKGASAPEAPPKDRAPRPDGAVASLKGRGLPASAAPGAHRQTPSNAPSLVSRLESLEREIRSLREIIEQMKRRCGK